MLPTNSHELTQLGSGPGCGYDSCAAPGRHEWTGIGNATPVTDPGLWRPPASFFRQGWKPVRADGLEPLGGLGTREAVAIAPQSVQDIIGLLRVRVADRCDSVAGSSTEVLEV